MKLGRSSNIIATLVFSLVIAATLKVHGEDIAPQLIDQANFDDFRRMWGAPDGAFYLMERGGCEIRTYPDKKARTIKLKGSRKLVSSDRGNFYGVVRYDSFSPSALSIREITLYSSTGKQQYTINEPDCSAFVISDEGPNVVGVSGVEGLGTTRLKFYNGRGKLVGTSDVESFSNPTFSANGAYLFALGSGGTLMKFNNSGQHLGDLLQCRKYFVSDDGEIVAAYSDTILTIITGSTQPIGLSIESDEMREIRFSHDGTRLAMLSTDRLEVFDLVDRSLVGEYRVEDSTYQLLHLAADENLNSIVVSASNSGAGPEIRHREGKVILFDGIARKLWEDELSYSDWSIRFPEVRMNRDGNLFSALTPNGLKVYEL